MKTFIALSFLFLLSIPVHSQEIVGSTWNSFTPQSKAAIAIGISLGANYQRAFDQEMISSLVRHTLGGEMHGELPLSFSGHRNPSDIVLALDIYFSSTNHLDQTVEKALSSMLPQELNPPSLTPSVVSPSL